MKNLSLFGVAMMAALAACGGDGSGGGGSGPVSSAQAASLCSDLCAHEIMCDSEDTQAECEADCTADLGSGVFRSDAANDLVDCVVEQACTASTNACATTCSPTSAHVAMETACRTKVMECGGAQEDADATCETTPSADGQVGFLCLITPSVINELADCYALPCSEAAACLDEVSERYDI